MCRFKIKHNFENKIKLLPLRFISLVYLPLKSRPHLFFISYDIK